MTNPIEVLITLTLPDTVVEQIRQVSPRLHVSYHPAKKAEDIPDDVLKKAEIIYVERMLPLPEQVPNLKWIHFMFAGIDFAVNAPLLQKPGVLITHASGAMSPQVAEHAVAMMLALGHHMPKMAALQQRAEWPPIAIRWEKLAPREVRGSTVGLVGYGSIGREIARLLQPFGCTILAAKRDVMHPRDTGFTFPGQGDPEGDLFTRLYPMEAVGSMMKECDFVIISLPLSPATRGIIGAAELAMMKPTAYLIDVGRGGVLDTAAILHVLQEKKIAGAALDVFAEEPLPVTSPFWQLPNLMITPHTAGVSLQFHERAGVVFAENLKRYVAGDPLINQYDPALGY